jgi:hypothetical protein
VSLPTNLNEGGFHVASLLTPASGKFLRECIQSALHLDLLILLHQEDSRWWTASSLSASLRTGAPQIIPALEDLAAFNLLEVRIASDVLYRYSPWDETTHRAVQEIARLCRSSRAAVVNVIESGRRARQQPT